MGVGYAMAGGLGVLSSRMRQDYEVEHQNALENLTGFMNFLRSQAQDANLHPTARSIWGGWYTRLASAPVTGRLKLAEQIHKEAEQLGQTVLAGHQTITADEQPPANLPPGAATASPPTGAMQAPPQTLYGAPSLQTAVYSSKALEMAKRLGDISAAEAWADYFKKQGVANEEIPFHVESMLGRPMPSGFFARTFGAGLMTGKQANEEGYLPANGQPWSDDAIVKPTIQRGQKVGMPNIGPTAPVTVPDTSGASPTGTAVGRATLGGQVLGPVPNIDPRLAGTQTATSTTQTPTGSVTEQVKKRTLPRQSALGVGVSGKSAGTGAQPFLKPAAQKVFQPMFDAETRLRTMNQNLEDVKQEATAGRTDQQAMVSLVANHISMVLGIPIGRVGRPSQRLLEDAEKSAPLGQRIKASFDSQGYLTGVVLTPYQMERMVALARSQYVNFRKQASEQAKMSGLEKYVPGIPDDIQTMLGMGSPPTGVKKPPRTAQELLQSIQQAGAGQQ